MHGLEAPDHLARRAAQRDDASSNNDRGRCAHRRRSPGSRCPIGTNKQIARGIGGEDRPRVRRSGVEARRAVGGGRQRRRTGRHRIEGPAQRAAARIEAAHDAARRVRAPSVADERADGHDVADQRGRRGDAVLARLDRPRPRVRSTLPPRRSRGTGRPSSASSASSRPSSVPVKIRFRQASSAARVSSLQSATPRHVSCQSSAISTFGSKTQRCAPVSASSAKTRLKGEQK